MRENSEAAPIPASAQLPDIEEYFGLIKVNNANAPLSGGIEVALITNQYWQHQILFSVKFPFPVAPGHFNVPV